MTLTFDEVLEYIAPAAQSAFIIDKALSAADEQSLKGILQNFCTESADDFAISERRLEKGKLKFLFVLHNLLHRFNENSEWNENLVDFFLKFEETDRGMRHGEMI